MEGKQWKEANGGAGPVGRAGGGVEEAAGGKGQGDRQKRGSRVMDNSCDPTPSPDPLLHLVHKSKTQSFFSPMLTGETTPVLDLSQYDTTAMSYRD